jgi:hypothetical protein
MGVNHVRLFPVSERARGQQVPIKFLEDGVMVASKALPDRLKAPDFWRGTQDLQLQHVVLDATAQEEDAREQFALNREYFSKPLFSIY